MNDVHLPRITWWLLVVALVLVFISGGTYVMFVLGGQQPGGWFQAWYLFDVGREHNIPTWYASFLWASLGALALLAARLTTRRVAWTFLAVVAFLASIDEYAELHERLDTVGNQWAAALGWQLWFTWVIPGMVITLVIATLLTPLVWRLPTGQRRLLIIAGAVFLSGAVGVETLSGLILSHFGDQVTWHYVLAVLMEELLELLGVALAVGAVAGLFHWRSSEGVLHVRLRGGDAAEPLGRRPSTAPLGLLTHEVEITLPSQPGTPSVRPESDLSRALSG